MGPWGGRRLRKPAASGAAGRARVLAVALTLAWAPAAPAALDHRGVAGVSLASRAAQSPSRQCGVCHSPEFALWIRHPHSRFLSDAVEDPERVLAEWGPETPGWAEQVRGRFERSQVALAYGVLRTQVYFADAPGGRHRLLPALWNLEQRRWEPLPPDLGALRESGTTWEEGCAGCHTTGFDPTAGSFDEANAGCRSCHGDGDEHRRRGGRAPILRPSELEPRRRAELCGRCHARGRDRSSGRPYPVDFTPGDELGRGFEVFAPRAGETTPYFWADGSERLPYMQFQGFLQSGHYRIGLSCTTCHLPHGSEHPRGLRRRSSELCTGCHGARVEGVPAHRAHPPEGADCVGCHMAATGTRPGGSGVHTHTFRVLGPADSGDPRRPSGCLGACHGERDRAWVRAVLERWRGP